MELPPSPPIFSDADVQKALEQQRAAAAQHAQHANGAGSGAAAGGHAHLNPPRMAPLSRSLNDFQYANFSMPASFISRPFVPSFGAVDESSDLHNAATPVSRSPSMANATPPRAGEHKATAASSSYNENASTVFSMLRKSSMSYSSPPSIVRRLANGAGGDDVDDDDDDDDTRSHDTSAGNGAAGAADATGLEDDLMFSLSLDPNEESHMLQDDHSQQHESSNYALQFRD